MNGRFLVSGAVRRYFTFRSASEAAKAASRRDAQTVDLMWCDDTWKPRLCIAHAAAGCFWPTQEGRKWAFDAGYERGSR